MELGRAITYIFEDKKWVSKLLPLMLVGLLSIIPIFGLIASALSLGYLLHLARHVREGRPRPLPEWDNWKIMLNDGAQVLMAIIFYNLPLVMISLCSYLLISGLASGFLGGGITSVVVFCCTAPIVILYSAIAWSILAIGTAEYLETGESRRLYRFFHLWDALRSNNNTVFQWILYASLSNIVLSILLAIPCIGWLIFLLFGYPVQGHLFGQFIHRLSVKNKPSKKAFN